MIKFVQCVKKKPEMTVADFRGHWREYREKIRALAEVIGAFKCAESTTLTVEQNLEIMAARGTAEPYDAVLEIWLENARAADERLGTPEAQKLLSDLQSFQESSVDLASSAFFFTSEDVFFE